MKKKHLFFLLITYKILILIMTINLAQSKDIDKAKKPDALADIRIKFPETSPMVCLSWILKVWLLLSKRDKKERLAVRFRRG